MTQSLKNFSQNPSINTMELKSIVLNQNTLSKFLIKEFDYYHTNRWDLFINNHPMEGFKFNRIYKNLNQRFSFINLPINGLYGYFNEPDEIAVYLLMQIDKYEMNNFVSVLGLPENITSQDYFNNDYETLIWRKNGLEITILHYFETPVPTNKRIVIIHHLKNHDFINWDPL